MRSFHQKQVALHLLCLLSLGLLIFRISVTGQLHFIFLVWNLFLAYIPFGISTLMELKKKDIDHWQFWVIAPLWLLFFPNALYILTDLFHLHKIVGMPEWFDLLLILSFAISGLLLGLFSLRSMHKIVEKLHSNWVGITFVLGSILLGSFGVYLGRFERYNSWDIFRMPLEITKDIANRILHPTDYPSTWGLTIGLSCLLAILYLFTGSNSVEKNRK
ncbi:MAG: DUF1361 domain-containing protein [Bacteroidetes bacterium]|nr:DUF1361 domain-containing protein [Bacteroidota bacterium]